MILLRGSRPDTSILPTVKSNQATPSNPFQSEADCSKGKAKQKRNAAQLDGPRAYDRRGPLCLLLISTSTADQYRSPNSGSTGFSNSEASRVTIVNPEGVTK